MIMISWASNILNIIQMLYRFIMHQLEVIIISKYSRKKWIIEASKVWIWITIEIANKIKCLITEEVNSSSSNSNNKIIWWMLWRLEKDSRRKRLKHMLLKLLKEKKIHQISNNIKIQICNSKLNLQMIMEEVKVVKRRKRRKRRSKRKLMKMK